MTGWLFKARAALADQLQVKAELDSARSGTVHKKKPASAVCSNFSLRFFPLASVGVDLFVLLSKLAKLADQTVNEETGSVPSRSEKKGRGNIFWRAGRGSVVSLVQLSNQRAHHIANAPMKRFCSTLASTIAFLWIVVDAAPLGLPYGSFDYRTFITKAHAIETRLSANAFK
ncbi:hypothetical protein T07_1040 [Trichinella nelsoni]|uniref:Uncharacterized protein n=1 Tax=Trichinella nelsoni TaxID=6336 RepID=A0A0V0S4X0_9BILA|nr:hypothetical protein T07_1040 [Trichinella nelsoni]